MLCFVAKAIQPKPQHRIPVSKDDQPCVRPGLSNFGGNAQYLRERGSVLERALAGTLDDWAVSHRITEGHAELDHVRSSVNRRKDDLLRGTEIGIAARNIHNQPG